MSAKHPEIECDTLLFFVTSSEERGLKYAAKELECQFCKRHVNDEHMGEFDFYDMGTIGRSRVNAVKTEMGPLGYGGSASMAIYFKTMTAATAIIQLGMAFGVDRKIQQPGDVLVAKSLYPYDNRNVVSAEAVAVIYPNNEQNDMDTEVLFHHSVSDAVKKDCYAFADSYKTDYSGVEAHRANPALVSMFERHWDKMCNAGDCGAYSVHFGAVLSGGARVGSRVFIRELIEGLPGTGDHVIGGEMEATGLLSVSSRSEPIWGIVKGISDFGDERRVEEVRENRVLACKNAAVFTLESIIDS